MLRRTTSSHRVWAGISDRLVHRGQYSLECVCALHDYSLQTSYAHVCFIFVIAALVPLLMILSLDAIPLQDPVEGWQKYVIIWVRRNDWLVVQGSFMAWVILIFQFTLKHNGEYVLFSMALRRCGC